MPINNSDERHDNEENELSSSDVPVYHMMDEVNEDEYDFANDNSDEESENNYELLSQDGDEHVNYYSHHMIVNWVDEQSDSEQQHSNIQVNHSEAISNQSQEDNQVTHKSSDDFSMSEEQINEIKNAMAGFQLPPQHIPQWASVVPEDQWKSAIVSLIQEKHNKS